MCPASPAFVETAAACQERPRLGLFTADEQAEYTFHAHKMLSFTMRPSHSQSLTITHDPDTTWVFGVFYLYLSSPPPASAQALGPSVLNLTQLHSLQLVPHQGQVTCTHHAIVPMSLQAQPQNIYMHTGTVMVDKLLPCPYIDLSS